MAIKYYTDTGFQHNLTIFSKILAAIFEQPL